MNKQQSQTTRRNRIRPSRRDVLKTSLLLGSGAVAASIARPARAEKKTLRYWSWLDPKDTNPRSKAQTIILDNFREKNPNLDVAVEVVDWRSIPQQLLLAVGASKGPDVVRLFSPTLPQVVAARAIRPLTQFVDAWSKDEKADIIPQWGETTWNEQLMAMFIENRLFVLFYRNDFFATAGKGAPRSWADVVDAAKAVRSDQRIGIAFPLNRKAGSIIAGFHMPALLWSFGGDVVDENGKGTFNSPAGVKFFQFLSDLAYKSQVMPPEVIGWDIDQASQGIMTGTLAMMYEGTNRLGHMRTAMRQASDLQVVPLPTESGAPNPTPVAGWTLAISRDAQDPEAAWRLIEHITSTESQIINAKVAGEMPTRRSTLKDPWFTGEYGSDMREWLEYAANHTRVNHAAKLTNANVLGDILATAAQQIVLNRSPIKETLDQAVARWNPMAR